MGILTRLFNPDIETRAAAFSLSDLDAMMDAAITGKPSSTGINISPDGALANTAVFACVRVLAETIAGLPLPVFERLPDGGKQRAPEHPLYRILHDAPNGEMTAFEWRECVMGHVALWGNRVWAGSGQLAHRD